MAPLIELKGVVKTFKLGDEVLQALDHGNFGKNSGDRRYERCRRQAFYSPRTIYL